MRLGRIRRIQARLIGGPLAGCEVHLRREVDASHEVLLAREGSRLAHRLLRHHPPIEAVYILESEGGQPRRGTDGVVLYVHEPEPERLSRRPVRVREMRWVGAVPPRWPGGPPSPISVAFESRVDHGPMARAAALAPEPSRQPWSRPSSRERPSSAHATMVGLPYVVPRRARRRRGRQTEERIRL